MEFMAQPPLHIYNTLTRQKELFEPVTPGFAGLYVCGPTVYGDPHLGHARPAVTFDVLFRLLKHLDYRVRYVRNITDVGHLENDADAGEDKIAKKARLEQVEPMEVADYYTHRYHEFMDRMGVLRPSIEPHASGHIIEQIELVKRILCAGYAYEAGGSVYFDVRKYAAGHHYGTLSGRNLDDIQSGSRELDGQDEKCFPADFALWKKASPEHIMRWPSPWSTGFPGWHLECSAMSAKYLGERFDIHGGGMDLLFPHHECEIAQNTAAAECGSPDCGCAPAAGKPGARYWMHNNMITINGQKMGKSLGNFITLEEFFTGGSPLLTQAYSPMVIRFFILQAHYRSTLDFSNEALQAAEKGYERLMKAWQVLGKIQPSAMSEGMAKPTEKIVEECLVPLCDDMNTPVALAELFSWIPIINTIAEGKAKISAAHLDRLKAAFDTVLGDILGLAPQSAAGNDTALIDGLVGMAVEQRNAAKAAKDWAASDVIRDRLAALGIKLKDGKEGTSWEIE